ncbi:uncharacterized protein [Argopecten irradians]|uniref:uncharacterized protein n=1 Tax=Argopecten irradians TaxID=31199 RepID=UPI0037174B7E
MCVEPEPRFAQRMFLHFMAGEVPRICPTRLDIVWRVGNEVFCTLLSILVTLLLGQAASIGNNVYKRYTVMASTFKEWRNRPSQCRHCGTVPCQVKRRSLWKPSVPHKREEDNFARRSNAMQMFSYGLELSVILTKELPQDDIYWQRKFCQYFEEKHLVLFPVCIQRQINYWYPLPR